jgi:DNA repair exonuclease SbcCD nuclease subunit
MRFHFVHAADLHIDSPLAGLRAKDGGVAASFARANRTAVEALVRETIDSGAKFLIISGDVFDGDWKDASTGLFFARQLGELHRAEIPAFLVRGNHDADSVMSRSLNLPESAYTFASGKAETKTIASLRVALHGRSFGARGVPDDFLASYPGRREGWLNVGLLHTGLDGVRGHETYAPCTVEDLRRFGYDYWALGHIHAAEIVARDPWIVYPGNIQGRSPRETGSKGAMRVTIEDGRVVAVEPMPLDSARWAHEEVDISGCLDEADILPRIGAALARAQLAAGDKPLAIRVTLTGETAAHAWLVAHREQLQDEARALGFQVAVECWVERLKIATRPPLRVAPTEADAFDIDALVAAAADDPDFNSIVSGIVASIAEKLPRDLREQAMADSDTVTALARDLLTGART